MGQVNELSGRKCVIVTQHAKEQVMAPLLTAELGVTIVEATEPFDTDALGTFTGEVERTGDARETARAKCGLVLGAGGLDLAVASEGSFFSDPLFPLLALNEELVLLVDAHRGLEVMGRHVTHRTNWASAPIQHADELQAFAARIGFPEHGLILRRPDGDAMKGLRSDAALREAWERLRGDTGGVLAESDMRALHNPTRMAAIREATRDLVERLQERCPRCARPGFGIDRKLPGLPCAVCGAATPRAHRAVHACPHCPHTETVPINCPPADPAECPRCNP